MDRLGIARLLLMVAIAVTGYLLLLRWQADYVTAPAAASLPSGGLEQDQTSDRVQLPSTLFPSDETPEPQANHQNINDRINDKDGLPPIADIASMNQVETTEVVKQELSDSEFYTVSTDTLTVQIDPLGGDIALVKLPEYPKSQGSEVPFTLLSPHNPFYEAQSGVLSDSGLDLDQNGRPQYHSNQKKAQLVGDALSFPLTFESNGLRVTKTYHFQRGSYLIRIETQVTNQSDKPWRGRFFAQIQRDDSGDPSGITGGFGLPTFNGAAYWSPEKKYNKLNFDDLEERFQTSHTGGWIAWVQHYFVAAWIPDSKAPLSVTGRKTSRGYAISYTEAVPTSINPGETVQFSARFYAGPKVEKRLGEIADGLNLAVDYGFLFMISKTLLHLLMFIQSFVGNWGISIILLTLLIKTLFLWPSAISYRSMARMRKLQPHLTRLKEEFGQDRQRMSQEMIKLYQKEKVNPFGGCLPVLLQMPVFIALYWALLESVELRQAPFFGWIQDLSAMDPYFVLPLLMGLSMYVQTSLNPTPPDPTQAKVMKLMPIVFTVFFLFFPAGLVLYWLTNNVLSILQQWIITRRVESSA